MDLHPDVRPGNEEDFLKVRDAYEALKTENERAKYLQYLKLVAKECVVCNGQGVIWKQKSFTSRTSLLCNACDGAGYE
jgi:DnaJ-class molecular chaperone